MSNDAKDDENEEEETEEDKIDQAEKEGEEDVDEDENENDEEKAAEDTDQERVCIIFSFGKNLLKTFLEIDYINDFSYIPFTFLTKSDIFISI